MTAFEQLPRSPHDKLLFTPGPLTTSMTVKQAMLRDLGPRDHEFRQLISEVRQGLLEIAGVSQIEGYEAIPMQGCGTMSLEAVFASVLPTPTRLLVLINGAYGERILRMAQRMSGVEPLAYRVPEDQTFDLEEVERRLVTDRSIAMVVVVHCETTSGILNPIADLGQLVRRHARRFFVDSMSAFGGVEFDFHDCGIDYLVSSANKCIEGVPGFAFALCRREALEQAGREARILSLDLLAQLRGFEADGQFLYTPPTHALLAFRQALAELKLEGGVAARAARYARNQRVLVDGMRALGFATFVPDALQSAVITTFRNPDSPGFDFQRFYDDLEQRGFVIYGGKVLHQATFRIGTIGRLFEADMRALLSAIGQTLATG
jgi:2-aminoethylphosphonate-pyruvate transaminase